MLLTPGEIVIVAAKEKISEEDHRGSMGYQEGIRIISLFSCWKIGWSGFECICLLQ